MYAASSHLHELALAIGAAGHHGVDAGRHVLLQHLPQRHKRASALLANLNYPSLTVHHGGMHPRRAWQAAAVGREENAGKGTDAARHQPGAQVDAEHLRRARFDSRQLRRARTPGQCRSRNLSPSSAKFGENGNTCMHYVGAQVKIAMARRATAKDGHSCCMCRMVLHMLAARSQCSCRAPSHGGHVSALQSQGQGKGSSNVRLRACLGQRPRGRRRVERRRRGGWRRLWQLRVRQVALQPGQGHGMLRWALM